MLFSSIPFLFYFLPPVLLLYFLTPDRWKNLTLLLSSLVFYGWGEPRFLLFMLASIAQGYAFGRLMERYPRHKRLFLALSAVLSLGLLGYCKYAGFFLRTLGALTGLSLPALQIALPIGISFYTFQVLSYVIDVYRGTVPPQRNLLQLATYVAMFPQLIAGPIVRYTDVAPQLQSRTHTVQDAALGARRFVLGLGKKVLLANVLYELVTVYQQSGQKTVLLTWMYAGAYMLHVYFDFSGYSDMAIGLGRMFGFRFLENFNYPYVSLSVTEFWRRWHISLSTCGITEKFDALAERDLQLTLSVSLHAPDDETRSKIMPANRGRGVEELMRCCRRYYDKTGRRISFEYAMIDGVNDTEYHARLLAKRAKAVCAHVNLIPLNHVEERQFAPSTAGHMKAFIKILEDEGVNVTVRRKLGGDVDASCGQLRRKMQTREEGLNRE